MANEKQQVENWRVGVIGHDGEHPLFEAAGTLTDAEYQAYYEAAEILRRWAKSDPYALVENAFARYVGTHNAFAESLKETPRPPMATIMLTLNAEFLGLLSLISLFLDHTRTKLERLTAEEADTERKAYRDITSREFDNVFAYRFTSKLRNYAMHCGMPINSIKASSELDRTTGGSKHHFEPVFNRDTLLREYDSWGAKVRPDLENMPEEFPVLPLAHELMNSMRKVAIDIAKSHTPRLMKSVAVVKATAAKVGDKEGVPHLFQLKLNEQGQPDFGNLTLQPIPMNLVDIVERLHTE